MGGGGGGGLCIRRTRLSAQKTYNTRDSQAGPIQKASGRRWPCKQTGFQSTEMVEGKEQAKPARGGLVSKGGLERQRGWTKSSEAWLYMGCPWKSCWVVKEGEGEALWSYGTSSGQASGFGATQGGAKAALERTT